MKKIELFIVPYAKENEIKTRLIVDGNKIDSKDNRLTNLVVYQPMRKWLNPYKKKLFMWGGLLPEIIEEFNDKSVHFVFHGCKADYTLFRKSLLQQQAKLNRNGGAVEVVFERKSPLSVKQIRKDLNEILDDLRVEADNWGEDEIISHIDALREELCTGAVTVMTDYCSASEELVNRLQSYQINVKEGALLTLIPVDGSVPLTAMGDFFSSLINDQTADCQYLVINTSEKENERLFDRVMSLDSVCGSRIKYLENDGEDYLKEIETEYFYSILPVAIQKTVEILHLYPDYTTNNYLIDISNRIDDLFCILLK